MKVNHKLKTEKYRNNSLMYQKLKIIFLLLFIVKNQRKEVARKEALK